MPKPLTAKQLAFCEEYLVDLAAGAAWVRAGYSARGARQSAHRLLRLPEIQERIQTLMAARSKRTEITVDYVLETIRDTVERCRQARPVTDRKGEPVYVETPEGNTAPAYTFDAQGVLKGAELLGKHLNIFTEKHEHSGPGGTPLTPPKIIVSFIDPGVQHG